MPPANITAVLFDWDLTLARVLGDVPQSERLKALFASQGLVFSLEQIQKAMKTQGNGTKPQTRQDIINFYFRMLAYLGHTCRDWEFGDRLYNAYGDLLTFLYDDTLPALKALQQRGVTLGIISNHAYSARKMIEENVAQFIRPDHIIISQEVGVHKPAKTIFRRAITRIRVPAPNCLFIGDNLEVDAIGAVEQGGFGRALWLDRENQGADRILPDRAARITSLDQLNPFL